ncbi:HET-domain-containing protein [Apiospora rasikravindrae]|uniref:HET-domain-containing protein n=1 Tax=Apiospora rasikravindrae TaxID=990691 RepID=A0ABR1T1Q4_9PEZI
MSATNRIHRALGDASRQTRLVTIDPFDPEFDRVMVCRTETFQLEGDDRPPYKALSYQWNALEGTKDIFLNKSLIEITNNLYRALVQFRGDATVRYLWVDALCIDQNNLDEKRHQIPLMGRIFSYAEEVLVWLMDRKMNCFDGENLVNYLESWIRATISAQGNPAVESLNSDQRPFSLCGDDSLFRFTGLRLDAFPPAISPPFDKERWTELCSLWDCPYWGRVWIIQEIMLSKKARCYWGRLPSISKAELSPLTQSEEYGIKLQAILLHAIIPPAVTKLSLLYGTKVTSGLSMSLADVVDLTSGSTATDPRDRVYGLLGLVDSQNMIEPDYDLTTAETYTCFATAEITRTNSLDVCFLSCGLDDRKTPDLPTWVPDLAITKYAEPFSLLKNLRGLCSAAGQNTLMMPTSNSGHMLSVKGWRATARIHLVETKLLGKPLFETLQSFYSDVMKSLSDFSRINQLPSGLPVLEIIFRTVVLDTSRYTAPHNLTRDELHAAQLREHFEQFCVVLGGFNEKRSAADQEACDFPLPSQEEFWGASGDLFEMKEEFESRNSIFNNVGLMLLCGDMMKSNDLFWTEDGYMGLATHGVQPGDIVCVLTGACIPVVLRPKDGRFMLVGECYCFGFMHGEATKGGDPEVFEII